MTPIVPGVQVDQRMTPVVPGLWEDGPAAPGPREDDPDIP
jgi:hypothetical protein